MPDYEQIMLNYLQLAVLSREKRQEQPTVKFLCLAGISATRAGYLKVAENCRQWVLELNPHHLIRTWESLPAALRDDDFHLFENQLHRFCHAEKAEFLLSQRESSEAPGSREHQAEQLLEQFRQCET